MWPAEVFYLTMVLTVGFGFTALFTSMFEMMRTGFILTVHIIFQMLAFLTIFITWFFYIFGITNFLSIGVSLTLILAIMSLLIWLSNMFRGLMLFRCMQGASSHTHVFSHQVLFVVLGFALMAAL
ncbi:MAG: hypothetical protein EAX86_05420 [Candidatus Heimdallarchaeota archaeon]|nr:hypothetical protein [Candidatus Heimdallarchaeota archaeon]